VGERESEREEVEEGLVNFLDGVARLVEADYSLFTLENIIT
jgi:hypothetical protein